MRKRGLAVVSLVVFASGCAGSEPPEIAAPRAGLNCVDDSFGCIAQRKATLQAMVSDPSRKWVKEPASATAYASGVRLFAFKNKKKDLSCEELAHGRKEADSAPATLRSAGSGLTPSQISRGAMLAHDVGRELGNEYNRRCKKS
ncbi:MAG: hypothetical protein ABL894_03460 [Hyphomicrobium sp.]